MTFQELIFALEKYWHAQGCVIQQPYDMEVGAGTFHPATFLRALGPEPWKVAYVQPSRRPKCRCRATASCGCLDLELLDPFMADHAAGIDQARLDIFLLQPGVAL